MLNPLNLNAMLNKKADRSNLERKRFLFFEIGIVTVLAILLIAFESGSRYLSDSGVADLSALTDPGDVEMIPITREITKVKPPRVPEVIIIVDEEEPIIDDFEIDWSVETNSSEAMEYYEFEDETEEIDVVDFFALQDPPSYHGGSQNEFQKHLQKLVKYPLAAQNAGISGKVIVQFIVDENGKVTGIKVIKSPHPSLSEAVKMAFAKTDRWTPGNQQGRKVQVAYTMPVFFQLN